MLSGTVTNMVPFGAFVDLGVGRDGLIPQAALRGGAGGPRPTGLLARAATAAFQAGMLAVGDEVRVQVTQVDAARQRISLALATSSDQGARG